MYLAIFLVGTLLIGVGYVWYTHVPTAPVGGATTPPATTIRTQIRTFVDTHWDKIGGTAAALLAVFLIIWMFGWMLPNVSEAYYKHGGGGFWLLVLVATFILPALIWPGRVRKILLWTLGVLLAGVILPALLPAIWEVGFGGSSSASTQTASRCDNVYRDYSLSDQPRPIPGNGCKMGWNLKAGGLVFIDRDNVEYPPIHKGDMVGTTPPALKWKAEGTYALVSARFYK